MDSSFLYEARNMRADDIRPYTRARKSKLNPNHNGSSYGALRKSGCRGGYHPPVRLQTQYNTLSEKEFPFYSACFFRSSPKKM